MREGLDPDAAKLLAILVTEIVHGGKYMVTEPVGVSVTGEREALMKLEAHLSEKMRRTYEVTADIPANKLIAVKNEATGRWHRGKLLSPMPDSSTSRSRVFLVDYGEFLMDVKINHLQPLPEEMQGISQQAYVVCLYGLIPLTVDVHLEDINDRFHFERNAIWTTASEIYAQALLESSACTYLKGIRVEGRTVHGEIFLNIVGQGLVSLNEEMCRKKYAFYSEEEYEKVIERELNVEGHIRLNEEASKKEADRSDQANPNKIKALKHVLMEDFMKEYACKKLMRQEIAVHALREMRQGVDMKDLQATDKRKREELEAQLLSSASRSLGRASVLSRWKEKEPTHSKGRGLASSPSVRRGDDSSPGSKPERNGPHSLLSLLDSLSSKRKENVDVFRGVSCGGGPSSAVGMIPAGYPIALNDPAPKKKTKRMLDVASVVNSPSALKSDEDLQKKKFGGSSIARQWRDSRVMANAERSDCKLNIRSRTDPLVDINETASTGASQVSSNSRVGYDFVQMCKSYAQSSLSQPGDRELVGCERNEPGPSMTLFDMKTKSDEMASPKNQKFVAKSEARVDLFDRIVKNNNMSQAIGATARETADSSSEAEVHATDAMNCRGLRPTSNDTLKIQCRMDLKHESNEHNVGDSECTLPNSLVVSGSGNTASKSIKEKSVNPLLSLLDLLKKRKRVNTSCDADKSVASPSNQKDCAVREINQSSIIDAHHDNKPWLSRSQIENNVEISISSDDIDNDACSTSKTLNEAPPVHQDCCIQSPTSGIESKKPKESFCSAEVNEWKNASLSSEGRDRTQLLERLSPVMEKPAPALTAEEENWRRQGSSNMYSSTIPSDSSEKTKDMGMEVNVSVNEEHCTSATATSRCANSAEHSSCKQSSKPGHSSSIERFFKLFHSRKPVGEFRIEGDMANLPAEIKQMSSSSQMDGKETRSSDSNLRDSSEDKSSDWNMNASEDCVSEVADDLRAECLSSNFIHNSSCEEDKRKPVELSDGNVSSAQGEFSGYIDNENHVNRSDDCMSREIREVHSLAKSLSKIEAKKNSIFLDAVKSEHIKDLSVRLPLCAAQESSSKCKDNSLPQTPVVNDEVSMPGTSSVDEMKEVEKQKTLEPEAVQPSSSFQPALPHLLSASWMSNLSGGDCFMTAQRIKMCRVLVRGHLLAQPIQSIAQAPFKEILHEALSKMGYRDPMRIQTYAWPALMRGHNLIMVNPPRSGKTLGYLLPLISFMLSPDLYTELPSGNGPLVLILCPTWNVVAQVNDYCKWLLQNVHIPTRIIPVYGGMEDEQTMPLVNGCEILIATPRCLLRIFRKSRITTNFDRLCHLVFDEADTMMKKFLPEVKEILKECRLTLKKRARLAAESNPSGDSDSYQVLKFIAAAKTWCPQLESLVKDTIEKPLLCIGSYLEAAVFAQLKPTLHVVGLQECLKGDEFTPPTSDDRMTKVDNFVLGVLKRSLGFERFVVTCESAAVVKRLAPKMMELGANLIVVHECQHHVDISEMHHRWLCSQLSGALPVLLISDKTLSEFNIGDADHLVHVGVPASSKTKFGLRFSTLMDNYRDIFAKEDNRRKCAVDIVVDVTEPEVEISGLIEFLQRLGMLIPPELEAAASKSLLSKEMMRKKDLLLCPSLKSFGECDASDCKYRHTVLPSVDQPLEGMPTCGQVCVKVLHVINASQISVRLLKHIKPDGTQVSLPNDYFHIAAGLSRHFRDPNNMMLHGTPRVRDMCVIESGHNIYQRAQVGAIVERSLDNHNPVTISINLIDEGTNKIVKAHQLLHLPDRFKEYPPQAKELIICRMMPRDLDTSWSKAASVKVAELLEESADKELDGREIVGVIVLALGNTLWVDPLECREWLEKQRTTIIHMAIRRDLICSGLAVENPDHIQKLRKLCEVAELSLPEKEIIHESSQSTPNEPYCAPELPDAALRPNDQSAEISWESLNCDDLIEVNVVAVESPSCFKVQKVSNDDVLSHLSEEIQKWVSTVQNTPCDEKSGVQNQYDIGSICIGFCKADDSWCRAKVLGLAKCVQIALENGHSETSDRGSGVDQEDVVHYKLLFVDYGDTAAVSVSEMIPIPASLMKVPFQSIECCLMGVKPIKKELEGRSEVALVDVWDVEAIDAFFTLSREKDNVEFYRPLLAKAFGTDGSGAHGGLRYRVVLYDKNDKGVKQIGEYLVEGGFADPCQVESSREKEDEMLTELEFHWIGEGALLPFTPEITDAIDQTIIQYEEPSLISDKASSCTPLAQGGSLTDESEFDRGENNDSDSFEIVMTEEELKMYEEKLRIFLGVPPRPKDTQSTASCLKSITYNEVSPDDHSSLASYEIISESSSQSIGRFEELTMDDTVRLEQSEVSSPDVSDMLKGSDSHKVLPGSVNVQELCPLNTIVECPSSGEISLEEELKENEKCCGHHANANEESSKIEINPGGIGGLVENIDLKTEENKSVSDDEKSGNSFTSLKSSGNAYVLEGQPSEEFIDRKSASVSSDVKCVTVSLKSEKEVHYPRVCPEDSEGTKETEILVNKSSQLSDENGGKGEAYDIDQSGMKVPSFFKGKGTENQDASIRKLQQVNMADVSISCCGYSENIGKDSSTLNGNDASKESASSIPVEEECHTVLDSYSVIETESCNRRNAGGTIQEPYSGMNLESEAIRPVGFHERNDSLALQKLVPDDDFSKGESIKSGEIIEVHCASEEAASGNLVSKGMPNCNENPTSDAVIAGTLTEQECDQAPSKSALCCKFSNEESLTMGEMQNVGCASEDGVMDHQASQEMAVSGVHPASEVIGVGTSDEGNSRQTPSVSLLNSEFSRESIKIDEIKNVECTNEEAAFGTQASEDMPNSDVYPACEAIVAVSLNERDSEQPTLTVVCDGKFSRTNEIDNFDCASAFGNQVSRGFSNNHVNPASEAIGVDEMDDSQVILKSVPDVDFSLGKFLKTDQVIAVDCASEEADVSNQVSQHVPESDVYQGSEVIVVGASDECVSNQSLFKSSSGSHFSKDGSNNLMRESPIMNHSCSNVDGNLFVGVENHSDVNLSSIASNRSSKECSDVAEPSVKPLLGRNLPRGRTEAATKERQKVADKLVEGFNSDNRESFHLENCCEPNSSVSMPPLIPAKIPQVKWIQNQWEIILTVELPDMKQYCVYWKSNKLLYIHATGGKSSGSCFALELPLWACSNTEECVHMPTSNSTLKLILPKGFTSMEWPRLLSSPIRPLWLSVDFDQLDVDEDEDTDDRPSEVINYKLSDDGTDSEDEGPDTGVRSEEVNYDPYDPFS